MKLLLITSVNPWSRSVATIHKWFEAGKKLGHEVAIYGEPNEELPDLKFTTSLKGIDAALFVVHVPSDLPVMPGLARIIDTIPKNKRVVVDLWGHYNDTIRPEHDFNHLEKMDNHLGWEWEEGLAAAGGVLTQPALKPLRSNVKPFLFHGFDPAAVVKPYAKPGEAIAAWREKPYGIVYGGSNWHRWHQLRGFFEEAAPAFDRIGKAMLLGWDWKERPQWAIEGGYVAVDTDPAWLNSIGVEIYDGFRFDKFAELAGYGRFSPVIHRPLFKHLGYVANRTFETFYADTIPVLMLPPDFVEAIYGPAALTLAPQNGVAAFLDDAMKRPEHYWEAVLRTRDHLAKHHSYERRYSELAALIR
jgi:hypothetical protein